MNRKAAIFGVLVLVGLLSVPAMADSGFNAQLFWPSIFGGNFVAIEDANTLCPLGFNAGLILNYANGPVETRIDDDPEADILNTLLTGDVMFGFGPTSWMAIGFDAPLHLYTRGRTLNDLEETIDASELQSKTELGDIRAEIKFRALEQEKHWLGLAIAPYVTFPTGDETRFLGEGRFTVGGTLMLEHDFEVLNVGLNGGYLYRGQEDIGTITVGDAIKFGAGISRTFDMGLSFSVEWWAAFYGNEDPELFQGNPMEVMGTLRYQFGKRGPRVIGAGSGGLTGGVGCPAYRLAAGVDYRYCRPVPTDGKLVINAVDQDGTPVAADLEIGGAQEMTVRTSARGKWKSKGIPAGRYTITATAGCFEPGDVTADVAVGKTAEATVRLTRIPTALTVVITDKYTGEKVDGRITFDLATPKEKTADVPGGELTMEMTPGGYKVIVSARGYEDQFTETTVESCRTNVLQAQLRKKIERIGNIYFDFDSDVIRRESYPVLDNVVEQINRLASFKKIIIEGHCSWEGTDEYNMNLSTRRATSVKRYLAAKGIDPEKLEIAPYGESRPIATNETEEGRSLNRRVEFIIEEK